MVQPFLDGLADLHPPSAEVEAVIEKARSGNYDAPANAGGSPDDELNLAFVRGLNALSKGEVSQAAAWFQQTLKGASDFLGAAFYLGATHALSGRDREAIGSWQMALLSDNPAPSTPSWSMRCRIGDGRQALECSRSAGAWTTTTRGCGAKPWRWRWWETSAARLPKLKDQLDNTRVDDQPLLFVAIQVLFRCHQQDKSLSPQPRPVPDLRRAPPEARGPNRALVETGGDRSLDARPVATPERDPCEPRVARARGTRRCRPRSTRAGQRQNSENLSATPKEIRVDSLFANTAASAMPV